MKSFGSTMDRAGSSLGSMFDNQNTGLWKTKKNNFLGKVSNSVSKTVAGALIKGANNTLGSAGISATEGIPYDAQRDPTTLYKDNKAINIANTNNINAKSEITKQISSLGMMSCMNDTSKWDQSVLDQMNWYNFASGTALNIYDSYKEKNNTMYRYAEAQKVVHSIFNPYYGVDPVFGMGPGQFITAQTKPNIDEKNDPSNCTISKLIELSRQKYSILGQARYKYADFMFCKELGMPNNHLITLRRYASPVGDRIHGPAVVDPTYFYDDSNTTGKPTKYWNNDVMTSDVGHMCCYFGGEDNKLEDILKYSFKQTYKNMNSTFDMIDSKEDNNSSPIGKLINSTSKNYNSWMEKGVSGSNNIITWAAQNGKIPYVSKYFANEGWYNSNSAMFHRDANKIYEPKNTIQEIDYYEGKLQFSHEFSIVFSYKLRSYDNISPKAAMLDLIGNITRTCYSRGTFWGGRRQINGAQPNASAWNKANAFIDNTWDKLGSGLSNLLNGNFSFQSFLGSVSGLASNIVNAAKNVANQIVNGDVKQTGNKISNFLTSLNKKTGIGGAMKGALKNYLGRPQSYALDSLLTGGNTGVWHLTIGNPLKPIITIGNLEVTNTEIQHLGPLGIDDFPTELKVTVSFKHARPRDAVDIEKMYMFGDKSYYKPHVRSNPVKIYNIFKGNTDDKGNDIIDQTIKADEGYATGLNKAVRDQANADKKTAEQIAESQKNGNNNSSNSTNDNTKKQQTEIKATTISDAEYNNEASAFIKANAGKVDNDNTSYFGLDYIGEFDITRMRANMDELS